MRRVIGSSYDEAPFYYEGSQSLNVVFRTDREALEQVLPPVLKPLSSRNLALARVTGPARSHMGSYLATYLFVPALLGDQPVMHMVTGMKTSFSGVVGARETWGMPLRLGDVKLKTEGDHLRAVASCDGVRFMDLVARLERNIAPSELSSGEMVERDGTVVATYMNAPGHQPNDSNRPFQYNSTFECRRRPWENHPTENALIGIKVEKVPGQGFSMAEYWEGSAVLNFPGGVPGDNWSVFPVHEVLTMNYSVKTGPNTLAPGFVIAEW